MCRRFTQSDIWRELVMSLTCLCQAAHLDHVAAWRWIDSANDGSQLRYSPGHLPGLSIFNVSGRAEDDPGLNDPVAYQAIAGG